MGANEIRVRRGFEPGEDPFDPRSNSRCLLDHGNRRKSPSANRVGIGVRASTRAAIYRWSQSRMAALDPTAADDQTHNPSYAQFLGRCACPPANNPHFGARALFFNDAARPRYDAAHSRPTAQVRLGMRCLTAARGIAERVYHRRCSARVPNGNAGSCSTGAHQLTRPQKERWKHPQGPPNRVGGLFPAKGPTP